MSEILHHEHIIEPSRLIRQKTIKDKHLYPSLTALASPKTGLVIIYLPSQPLTAPSPLHLLPPGDSQEPVRPMLIEFRCLNHLRVLAKEQKEISRDQRPNRSYLLSIINPF
jgi:hypothetical protein